MESASEWFARFPDLAKSPLFTLRLTLRDYTKHDAPEFTASVRAWEGPPSTAVGSYPTHITLFCELKIGRGEPLFPRAGFRVGIPHHQTIDGNYAKSTVLSLFSLKPGDTDAEFFADYTPEQLDFVTQYGDEISMIRAERYGED